MKKNKQIIIAAIVIVVVTIIAVAYVFIKKGKHLETYDPVAEQEEIQKTEARAYYNCNSLDIDSYYIWSNPGVGSLDKLFTRESGNKFKRIFASDNNFDASSVEHVLWYNTVNDKHIPTMYEDDLLIYVSKTAIPYEGVTWERFMDCGYTIGVIGFTEDASGHYRLNQTSDENYKGLYYSKSDAVQINTFDKIPALFLDKVGNMPVRAGTISDIGIVEGLEKDKKYTCEWYTGSYFRNIDMTANTHVFYHLESFSTYKYDFEHSEFIVIEIPNWFKTGYYYIDNVGLIRYVKNKDASFAKEDPFSEYINWNDPIIITDSEGKIVYDPTGTYTVIDNDNSDSGNISDSGWDE